MCLFGVRSLLQLWLPPSEPSNHEYQGHILRQAWQKSCHWEVVNFLLMSWNAASYAKMVMCMLTRYSNEKSISCVTFLLAYKRIRVWNVAGDSWHSHILISGSSFIFANEMNNFRYYLTSSPSCLKGFANTKL